MLSFTKLLQLNYKISGLLCYNEFMNEKFKKSYEFLKKPNLLFTILCYVLFAGFGMLAIVFLMQNMQGFLIYFAYSGMAVTFFYCCYLFIRYDFKAIRNWYKNTKQKLMDKHKVVNGYFSDYYSRTMINTIFSLVLGVCFVAYNAVVGLVYHSVWNGSISVYYMFLVGIRILYLVGEYRLSKNTKIDDIQKEKRRAKMFTFGGAMMLLLSFALVVPITLLALSKKQVSLPMWVAIADATYVFYKLTMCIYAFVKTRKNNVLSVKGIKNLNLMAVAVTLLSLENTMIITFSEGVDSSMQILMILSAVVVMAVNIYIAISTIVSGKKELKKLKGEEYGEDIIG